ncbi:DNA-formamidopyrimidine glycosylase, partial [Salmonella enterica subsp. enterica serovar Derby]
ETLWRVRRHPETPCSRLSQSEAVELLQTARDVMAEAMSQGGTSFDSLYVNVNGESGWFFRVVDAYGREDEPCHRCGMPIVRESFMNRSSFRCPRCQ